MPKVRANSLCISLDGFAAGPRQSLQDPIGSGGLALFEWFFATRTFQRQHGQVPDEFANTGIDDDFARRGFANVGAWILGRNMFGPERGPWLNEDWRGWWGDNPPFHTEVFVLTKHSRDPIEMQGGTTFHFVTGGIHVALEQARQAAGSEDIRIGGGVHTVRQYLRERLIDELHLAFAPILLGCGESLFEGIDLPALGYRVTEHVPSAGVTHVVLSRNP